MDVTNFDRADILVQALPYIQKYAGQTVVVKYGGNAMIDDALKDMVMTDLVLLSLVGVRVVLVHGGGPEIDEMLRRVGKESRFVEGLRYTDEDTIEIVQMVLAGKINKSLTQLLQSHGGRAMGLCGLDGGMLTAKRHAATDVGLVGDLVRVDPSIIQDALGSGYLPVIATIAGGEDKRVYNMNADTAAAAIAAELGALKLLLMTDMPGLLEQKDDPSTLIPAVQVSDVQRLVREGVISGGMIPKVECCVEAVRRGVRQTNIIDGRVPHSILIEMLTDEGSGTMFV